MGWEVKGGIPSPCVATGLPAPQVLFDVINGGYESGGIAGSTESSNCHKTCHALSILHAQQPMGVATHIQ